MAKLPEDRIAIQEGIDDLDAAKAAKPETSYGVWFVQSTEGDRLRSTGMIGHVPTLEEAEQVAAKQATPSVPEWFSKSWPEGSPIIVKNRGEQGASGESLDGKYVKMVLPCVDESDQYAEEYEGIVLVRKGSEAKVLEEARGKIKQVLGGEQ